jgi:ATP-dependent Lhr-like helicase
VRRTPITLVPRDQLDAWTALSAAVERPEPGSIARQVREVLASRGAMFVQELARAARLPMASVEEGLASLVAAGRVTCDSYGGLRWLLLPSWRRKGAGVSSGRWSLLHREETALEGSQPAEFVAHQLLRRTGVLFRRTLVRERIPVPWWQVARACRTLEARGEIRGGRFVAGFDGEQYALPEAVTLLRKVRRRQRSIDGGALHVSAVDPLNFQGILTPEERVPASSDLQVQVG